MNKTKSNSAYEFSFRADNRYTIRTSEIAEVDKKRTQATDSILQACLVPEVVLLCQSSRVKAQLQKRIL